MNTTILDYGAGNLGSAFKFFKLFDSLEVEIRDNLIDINKVDLLIIPGVGSFGYGCQRLNSIKGLTSKIKKFVEKGGLLIGICLGAQLFLENSEESTDSKGLSLVNGGSYYLGSNKNYNETIPRVGWDEILWPFSNNLPQKRYCYFVHSYEMKPLNTEKIIYTNDGIVAAYKNKNIWGMQFHPEKSNLCGYNIFKSILSIYAEEN